MKKFLALILILLQFMVPISIKAENSITLTDPYTGRLMDFITINNQNTSRPYFTQLMWTADSKSLILCNTADGYSYEYNTETKETKKLVKSGSDFYVTPTNWLYYINRTTKTIDRYNLTTYQNEQITPFVEGTSTPGSIHVTNDGNRFSVVWLETESDLDYEINEDGSLVNRYRRIAVYDLEKKEWDLRYTHEFDAPLPYMTHVMINPVYGNLVFFCHEGTTTKVPDRLWSIDLNTGEQKNIFKQYYNYKGTTGETSGHECWSADGEYISFVKYSKAGNVGQNGIVRIDKYGEQREYINGDYLYWHQHPSSDNRFIVADTQEKLSDDPVLNFRTGMTDIVLIDCKTSRSIRAARVKIGVNHPWQPHPAFSPDGKKISFAMIGDNNVLGAGVMDVSDIVEKPADEAVVNDSFVNEDYGFSLSSVKTAPENGKTAFSTEISADTAQSLSFVSAGYDNDGRLIDIGVTKKTLAGGETAEFKNLVSRADGYKSFLWDENLKPFSLKPTAPQRLRQYKRIDNTITMVWFPPENLNDVREYAVYRNGTEIGRTDELIFTDRNLSPASEYEYEVRAVFENGELSPAAFGRFTTMSGAYAVLNPELTHESMNFYVNTSKASDSYTEKAYIGGRHCRTSTTQQVTLADGSVVTKTGKFYFQVDKNYINSLDSKVKFTVTYYDEGTGDIRIEYNSKTGIAARAPLVKRTNTLQWLTAEVTVEDAEFRHAPALTNCDFRVEAGSGAYISEVRVTRIGEPQDEVYQKVTAALGENCEFNGLTQYIAAGGDCATSAAEYLGVPCREAAKGKCFYFNVADEFMYGASAHDATVTISYLDVGTGSIQLHYNSGDVTIKPAGGNTAYKVITVGNKTNTGLWKTMSFSIIDAAFTNAQDEPYKADFRIMGSDGLILSYVKVIDRV